MVFAPLGLLSGVVGDFFKALSITLSVAVLISLVLSLTLIPLLARAAHRSGAEQHAASGPAAAHRPLVRRDAAGAGAAARLGRSSPRWCWPASVVRAYLQRGHRLLARG